MVSSNYQSPGLFRLYAAFFYDLVLLLGLLLLATTFAVLPAQGIFGIENIGQSPLFRLLLIAVIAIFYVWFWTHGGQTLGMRAWRIRLIRNDSVADISTKTALLRLFFGTLLFGTGTLWLLFGHDGRTLYDRLARTRLVMLEKKIR